MKRGVKKVCICAPPPPQTREEERERRRHSSALLYVRPINAASLTFHEAAQNGTLLLRVHSCVFFFFFFFTYPLCGFKGEKVVHFFPFNAQKKKKKKHRIPYYDVTNTSRAEKQCTRAREKELHKGKGPSDGFYFFISIVSFPSPLLKQRALSFFFFLFVWLLAFSLDPS